MESGITIDFLRVNNYNYLSDIIIVYVRVWVCIEWFMEIISDRLNRVDNF